MRFAGFSYTHRSLNLGDQIQSIAAERFLPRIDVRVERDGLDSLSLKEKFLLVMNGWFSHRSECWPPADCIRPVFFGFHMAPHTTPCYLAPLKRDYLRLWGPIGSRERKTCDSLQLAGVDSYVSGCPTLTLPQRQSTPTHGKVFIVDADWAPIPDSIWRQAVYCTHQISDLFDERRRRELAQEHLIAYRDLASVVITSRLHCALPCIAMGIPVVFFGDASDYRIDPVKAIGLQIHSKPSRPTVCERARNRLGMRRPRQEIDWSPPPLDVGEAKSRMILALSSLLVESGLQTQIDPSNNDSVSPIDAIH